MTLFFIFYINNSYFGGVVQSVEQRTHIPYVTGSIPVATNFRHSKTDLNFKINGMPFFVLDLLYKVMELTNKIET